MSGAAPRPYSDQFKEWFTDREGEQAHFRTLLHEKAGTTVPIQSYVGVTGSGKTYLRRRLEEVSRTLGVKTVAIELDPLKQGVSRPDPASLVSPHGQLVSDDPSPNGAKVLRRRAKGFPCPQPW